MQAGGAGGLYDGAVFGFLFVLRRRVGRRLKALFSFVFVERHDGYCNAKPAAQVATRLADPARIRLGIRLGRYTDSFPRSSHESGLANVASPCNGLPFFFVFLNSC